MSLRTSSSSRSSSSRKSSSGRLSGSVHNSSKRSGSTARSNNTKKSSGAGRLNGNVHNSPSRNSHTSSPARTDHVSLSNKSNKSTGKGNSQGTLTGRVVNGQSGSVQAHHSSSSVSPSAAQIKKAAAEAKGKTNSAGVINGASHREVSKAVAEKIQKESRSGVIHGVSHQDLASAVIQKVKNESGPGILNPVVNTRVLAAETGPTVQELLKEIPEPPDSIKPAESFRQNTNHNCYGTCAIKAAKGAYSTAFRDKFALYAKELIKHPEKRKLYGSLYYDEKHPSWKLHPNAAGATKGGKYYFDPLQEFLESEITKRDANGYGNAKNALEFITGQKAVTEGTILHDPKYANPDFWYDSKTGKANEENIKKHITDPLEAGKMLIATHYADDGHTSSHSVLITAYDSDKKELTIQDPWKNSIYTRKIPEVFNKKFSGDVIINGKLTDVTYLE